MPPRPAITSGVPSLIFAEGARRASEELRSSGHDWRACRTLTAIGGPRKASTAPYTKRGVVGDFGIQVARGFQ